MIKRQEPATTKPPITDLYVGISFQMINPKSVANGIAKYLSVTKIVTLHIYNSVPKILNK